MDKDPFILDSSENFSWVETRKKFQDKFEGELLIGKHFFFPIKNMWWYIVFVD